MIYKNITNFLKKRTIELIGLFLILSSLMLGASFFSYTPSDPTLIIGLNNVDINNLLGIYGSLVADFLLQSFGLSAFFLLTTIMIWGISLIAKKKINKIQYKIFFLILHLIFSCLFIYTTFNNSFWLIDNGNSGFVGQIFYNWILIILPDIANEYVASFFALLSLLFFCLASNINNKYF